MSCISLTNLAVNTDCGSGSIGGIEKAWMIAAKDLVAINSGTTEVYSATTAGTVTAIGVSAPNKFASIGIVKNTSGLKVSFTADVTKGVYFFTNNFTLFLTDMTSENHAFINAVSNQPVAVIIKSRNNRYYAFGLNLTLQLSAVDGGTGTAEADGSGYSLTFEGSQSTMPYLLDSSILASIVNS